MEHSAKASVYDFQEEDEGQMYVQHNPMIIDSDEELSNRQTLAPESDREVEHQSAKYTTTTTLSMRRLSHISDDHPLRDMLRLPRVNCPEKIILCLDLSSEMDQPQFKMGNGSKHTPLEMAIRALRIFIQSKTMINPKHEFAIVLLADTVIWYHDFTSDTRDLISALDDVTETRPCHSFSMTSLFDLIAEKIELPEVEHSSIISCPYVVRTVLIYGRSQCVPDFSCSKESQHHLVQSDYFFIDIFYIHELPSVENNCEAIFDLLCDLDEKGTAYIFEVCRNATRLHDSMAKLLAHPLQRPAQKDTHYRLTPGTPSPLPSPLSSPTRPSAPPPPHSPPPPLYPKASRV